jgi:hypothetical protein
MTKAEPIIQQTKERKWKWIRNTLRERFRSDRDKFSIGALRDDVREGDLKEFF